MFNYKLDGGQYSVEYIHIKEIESVISKKMMDERGWASDDYSATITICKNGSNTNMYKYKCKVIPYKEVTDIIFDIKLEEK